MNWPDLNLPPINLWNVPRIGRDGMSEIKLPCKMEPWDGRVVDANDMYVDIEHVLLCVNYHHRLREALEDIVELQFVDAPQRMVAALNNAASILTELNNLESSYE